MITVLQKVVSTFAKHGSYSSHTLKGNKVQDRLRTQSNRKIKHKRINGFSNSQKGIQRLGKYKGEYNLRKKKKEKTETGKKITQQKKIK